MILIKDLSKHAQNYLTSIGFSIEDRIDTQIPYLISWGDAERTPFHIEPTFGTRCTPLGVALNNNEFDIINELLDKGANVSLTAFGCYSPLFIAVDRNNYSAIKRLLKLGADINQPNESIDNNAILENKPEENRQEQYLLQDAQSMTPIFSAAMYGNTALVKWLMKQGADVKHKTHIYNRNCLHYAIRYEGQLDTIIVLLMAGIDIDVKEKKWGFTPLEMAKHCPIGLPPFYDACPRDIAAKALTVAQSIYENTANDKRKSADKPPELYYQGLNGIARKVSRQEIAKICGFIWTESLLDPYNMNPLTISFANEQVPFLIKYINKTINHILINLVPLKKGQFVCDYTGILYSSNTHRNQSEYCHYATPYMDSEMMKKLQKIDDFPRDIDSKHYGNAGRFIAHLPTSAMLKSYYELTEISEPIATENLDRVFSLNNGVISLSFYANQDIPANSILGYNYGLEYLMSNDFTFSLFEKNGTPMNNFKPKLFHIKIISAKDDGESIYKVLTPETLQRACAQSYNIIFEEKKTLAVSSMDIENAIKQGNPFLQLYGTPIAASELQSFKARNDKPQPNVNNNSSPLLYAYSRPNSTTSLENRSNLTYRMGPSRNN